MQADFSNISLAGPDDYARAAAMRDPNRRDRLANALAYYIPPELGGWMELFDYINPVSDVSRAMQSSQNMLAPDRTAWERLGAFGSMATDIASVVAPAAAVRLAGGSAADGLVNALSFATMPADDALTRFAAADDGAIRAFHGSPHDFDRFSMDKIGTGEGAQAYGHGLYFAESEGVARQYRDTLTGKHNIGQISDFPDDDAGFSASVAMQEAFGDFDKAREIIEGSKRNIERRIRLFGEDPRDTAKLASYDSALSMLDNARAKGRLYEVNINANPEDFLDWDRPLSEQPQKVREAIERVTPPKVFAKRDGTFQAYLEGPDGFPVTFDGATREEAIQKAMQGLTGAHAVKGNVPSLVSRELSEAGIPGIRYLDAGSRGAGDGSRNYVVFDENLIEIVKKYGIAGAAAIYGVNEADIQSAMPGGI